MDDTGRVTGAVERRPDATRARQNSPKAGAGSLDELHGPLDTAWRAVNEVARLVDEIHRGRGRRGIR